MLRCPKGHTTMQTENLPQSAFSPALAQFIGQVTGSPTKPRDLKEAPVLTTHFMFEGPMSFDDEADE